MVAVVVCSRVAVGVAAVAYMGNNRSFAARREDSGERVGDCDRLWAAVVLSFPWDERRAQQKSGLTTAKKKSGITALTFILR